MCNWIKDNGEQCDIDNHDGDYCHLHEDEVDSNDADSRTESVLLDDGVAYCQSCKTAVLPTVLDITDAAFKANTKVIEQGLACGCQSVECEWAHPTLPTSEVPESWL